jgi:uncharacterized protein (DUF1330 family)
MNAMRDRFRVTLAMFAGVALGGAAVQGLHAQTKPPAYVILEIEATDEQVYQKEYVPAARTTITQSGGRFIVQGGKSQSLVGAPPSRRFAVIAWENAEKAQAWYASEAYQKLIPIRDRTSKFRAFIIEGVAN